MSVLDHRHGFARHALSPLLAVVALVAGTVAFSGSSAADVSEGGGGAFGARVHLTMSGRPPVTTAPLPAVTLPPAGGRVDGAEPSLSVEEEGPSGLFGGKVLTTGMLSVTTHGATESETSSTSSASVAQVDALSGFLTATEVASTCTSPESGPPTGMTTLTDGSLWWSETARAGLPPDPAPNTVVNDITTATGEPVTVFLNEQEVVGDSIVVNAVRISFDGPSVVGEVVLGQSRCGSAAAGLDIPASSQPPVERPTPASDQRSPEPGGSTEASAELSTDGVPVTLSGPSAGRLAESSHDVGNPAVVEGTPAGDNNSAAAVSPGGGSRESAASSSSGGDPVFAATQASGVSSVTGSAFGASVEVSLFGGAPNKVGPDPVVTLPPSGGNEQGSLPSMIAQFGPATVFGGKYQEPGRNPSGALTVSTEGTTGPNGSVTSSAKVVNIGPGPLIADEMSSTCTADANGVSGSATVVNGVLETAYDPVSQEASATEPVPEKPAVNYTRQGTIDHVGDSFRIVYNEQITNPDGSLTVNAAHMYLLGPTAVGELIVGQSVCGVNAAGAGRGAGATGGGAGTGAGAGTGSGAGTGAGSGSRSGTGTGAGSGARTGNLADTGGETPLLLASLLMLAAFRSWRWSRANPAEEQEAAAGGSP